MGQHVSAGARVAVAAFAAAALAVAAFVGAAGARAEVGPGGSRILPGHYQDHRTERDADMIQHGAYFSWQVKEECSRPDNGAECARAMQDGNVALAPFGLLIMADGSVGPIG